MVVAIRPLKITFMGDSTTHAVDAASNTSSTGGQRSIIWDSLKADYVVNFTGTVTDSLAWFPDLHEGWNGLGIGGPAASGGPVPQIYDKVSNLTTDLSDIVVLMAGINDLLQPWTTSAKRGTMLTRMGQLLDLIHSTRPLAKVLLCSIPIVNSSQYPIGADAVQVLESDRTTYNAGLPALASARSSWCTFVDAASGITTADLSDQVHPGPSGHVKLAANILPALQTMIASFTATALADGNDYTFVGGVVGRSGYDAFLTRVAAQLGRTVPALTSVDEASPLPASIERGNWVVQHPSGGGCEAVFLDRLLTLSTITWNASTANKWRPVSMPDTATRSEIERLLGYRTVDQRWWTTESIATLQAENASLGLST